MSNINGKAASALEAKKEGTPSAVLNSISGVEIQMEVYKKVCFVAETLLCKSQTN
jgi:hypothetical protein